ncbi:MAG: DUF3501 family protein [Gammaproteobacteria bacterium]|nr:DUF3501 family protein [Gammaproteobacteria bacterium]
MQKLKRSDLWPLEQYAERRPEFRRQVLEHKRARQVALGPHARVYFEDRLTIQYQIQEMLRIERIFEPAAIQDELDAYNPLVPDGSNWKATFMIEYEDPGERQAALERLSGIEDRVWLQIAGHEKNYAIADEDIERERDDKTSAVHFLRFEIPKAAAAAVLAGAGMGMGIDHPNCMIEHISVAPEVLTSLRNDLDPV